MKEPIVNEELIRSAAAFCKAMEREPDLSWLKADRSKQHFFCGSQQALDGVRKDVEDGVLDADAIQVWVPR